MTEPQTDFLASEYSPSSPDDALFHVIPVPLEKTVSYGSGTARGPQAILDASYQLEAFDGVSYPGEAGIYTERAINCSGDIQEVLERIQAVSRGVFEHGKVPVLLGGEHSLTLAPVLALVDLHSDFGVVQIDAHADLRDTYDGTPYSHACVMRRVAELDIPVFQIGVRNLCREEVEFRSAENIPFLDAREIDRSGLPDPLLPEEFPQNVYLTFDIDGLDAALMPATGTPEPGGLSWWQAITAIERIVAGGRQILGIDIVELAPLPHVHSPNYVAAKLCYALIGFAHRSMPGRGGAMGGNAVGGTR